MERLVSGGVGEAGAAALCSLSASSLTTRGAEGTPSEVCNTTETFQILTTGVPPQWLTSRESLGQVDAAVMVPAASHGRPDPEGLEAPTPQDGGVTKPSAGGTHTRAACPSARAAGTNCSGPG